jgi:outer membrane immunogenic protein
MWGRDMKKLLIATAISLALATVASAADLPPPIFTKAPVSAPAWSWTGFYVGANVGGGFGRDTDTVTAVLPGIGTAYGKARSDTSGVIGGGQIGYNWQVGKIVLGVEADIDGSSQKSSGTIPCPVGGCGGVIASATANDSLQDFGTFRGRVGYAFDRWLVYGTGGTSWQSVKESYSVSAAGVGVPLFSSTTTHFGYAAGAGVEAMLWDSHWIGGVEYLYLDSGTFGVGASSLAAVALAPAGSTLTTSGHFQNNVVRARLSYKF